MNRMMNFLDLKMKHINIIFIFIFFLISYANSQTVVRIRLSVSTATGQLRGVSGTATEGLRIQGTYHSGHKSHRFIISVTGEYQLWYDNAGGSNYTLDSDYGTGANNSKWLMSSDVKDTPDSSLTTAKFTQATIDFIGSGGSMTNNPDDISTETKTGSKIGIKESFFNTAFLDNYASLHAALDSIGSASQILFINKSTAITKNDTVPSNVTLFFAHKAHISGSDTLTINGPIKNSPIHWVNENLNLVFGDLAKSAKLYFENFGATGDGATDDSVAFYRALDLADGILVMGVEGRTYRITNSASLSIYNRHINIGSSGGVFTIKPDSQLFDIRGDGSISTTSMTENYKPGTDTILVAESDNISVDDYIGIRSDELWDFDSAIKQELVRVKQILTASGGNDDTLLVQPALVDEYTAETVTVRIYNTKKLQLRNFVIEYPANTNVKAIEAYYFSPVQLENVSFKNCERTGIEFFDCSQGYIRNCHGEYIDGNGLGYMIYMNGSTDIDVGPGNTMYHGRGGLIDGGNVVSRRITIFRNTVSNLQSSTDRVAGNHPACEHWIWMANTFSDCNVGIFIRGEQNYIVNNTFINVSTPVAINGGGTIFVRSNQIYSNHSWRGGIGIDYDDNLASHIVSISENVDLTTASKYVIENNFAEVKQCIVDASIGDTLYNLVVKNNTIYGDYSSDNNGFFEVIGSAGTHLIDADIRLNTIIAPDTLKDFSKTFNTAISYDTAKISLDNLKKKDQIFINQAKLQIDRIFQYYDTTLNVYRWDTPNGDSTFTLQFSDSLQSPLANNHSFETNIANWGSKNATNSYETSAPLVGSGSIKMVSNSGLAGSIVDTAITLSANTTYNISGVLKLTAGSNNKDIRVSMFQKQTGNAFVKQLPLKTLGKAILNTKVTFSGEFTTPTDAAFTHYGIQVDDLNTTFIADSLYIRKKEYYGLQTKIVGKTDLDNVSVKDSSRIGNNGNWIKERKVIGKHLAFITTSNDTFYTSTKNDSTSF